MCYRTRVLKGEMKEQEKTKETESIKLAKYRCRKKVSSVWRWCKEDDDGSVICQFAGCGKVCHA